MRGVDAGSLDAARDGDPRAAVARSPRRAASTRRSELRGGDPVTLDAELVREPRSTPRSGRGIAAEPTWSGAGHDAQHLAALVPTLLLFVPLRGGESHTPLEDADADEIERATLVAIDVLAGR